MEETEARRDLFAWIYREKIWGGESFSGPGSGRSRMAPVVPKIAKLLRTLEVASIIDAPCGEFGWFRDVEIGRASYLGIDIVPDIIRLNAARANNSRYRFITADLVAESLPRADLIVCRDLLPHLDNMDALRVLDNIQRSGSRYLLATTTENLPAEIANSVVLQREKGPWHPIDLRLPPFEFPEPLVVLGDQGPEDKLQKVLALWRIADIGNRDQ